LQSTLSPKIAGNFDSLLQESDRWSYFVTLPTTSGGVVSDVSSVWLYTLSLELLLHEAASFHLS
jgi:hypothetical protein